MPSPAYILGSLGGLLLDAGVSVTDVRGDLDVVARAAGHELSFSVLPQLVIVSDRNTGAATVVEGTGADLAMRQTAQATRLTRQLGRGEQTLDAVPARIRDIRAAAPAYRALRWIVGSGLIGAGLALVMRTPWWSVVLALLVGALVGAVSLLMERLPGAAAIAPFVAALVSTSIVGSVADLFGFGSVPLFAVCAPVAILVPGALITNALLELTGSDIITGSARLASGVIMLGFMAAGIAAGAALTGLRLDSAAAMLVGRSRALGSTAAGWAALPATWAVWPGVVALALGCALAFGAGWRLAAVSVAVMLCTYAVLVLLTPPLGTVVASGATLCVLFVAARLIDAATHAVPATVLFQPAFLLMVPGTVGLVALAAADVGAVMTAVTTFVSLCVGTKLGSLAVPRRA